MACAVRRPTETRNPKHEIRNKQQTANSNVQNSRPNLEVRGLEISVFEFVVCFGFRASDFGLVCLKLLIPARR
jgi:hypothetical protein